MDQDREQRIRRRAYQIWEREGQHDGGHEAHWQQAEQELRAEDLREREKGNDASGQTVAGPAGGKKATRAPRKKKESAVSSKGER